MESEIEGTEEERRFRIAITCDACGGTGEVISECPTCGEDTLLTTCPECNGEGTVEAP